MGTRRALLIGVPLLAIVAAVVLVLVLEATTGAGAPPPPAPPVGMEPLAFMPAGTSAVLDLDTSQASAGLIAVALIPELPGATLSAEQVQRLTGGRMAVGFADGRLWVAAQSRAAPPRPSGGAVAATRDGTVVIAPDAPALAGVAGRRRRRGAGARAAFDRRFAGLPASGARVAFDPRAALADRSPAVARTAWGRSLREGAAVLVIRGDRVVLPFAVSADPTGLSPASLPIATGAGPPRAAGQRAGRRRGPLTRADAVVPALRRPAPCARRARPRAGLPPPRPLGSRSAGHDRRLRPAHLTVRTTPPDPEDWSTKLDRLDALSGLIRFAGLADVRIDREPNGAYSIESDGALAGRVGVYGPVVVFSTDPRADLDAAARAPVDPPVPGAAGALTVRLAPSLFGALLPAIARGHIADVTGWARADLSSVRGELAVQVR